ncbi:Xaa-Pro aminopeptidase [Fictibacillus solisalsi]|uniref:Xaa-Pro aminopeptidase n=1 Tax=Fictibacillus solisalsi TaxID=459525 RepID=A0A1G9W961_9BACL|nr:Xaa-Pro peptidase family protein [Fictibacillus solisalsi]SDM80746.1 Xaa-Pro aminopeptidase [Fictibacillus solisalsi]
MAKLEKLRNGFENHEIDGLIVTSAINRRYLSGFTGSSGVLVISEQEARLITDFRYVDQAAEQANDFEIVRHSTSIQETVAAALKEMGIQKAGFEQDHLTFAGFKTYKKYASGVGTELVPVSGLIEKLRLIKDKSEIKILKEAAQIADAAFSHITSYIKPGVTELDVSNELEFFMRKNGADSSSFDIIVASGYRSALPHGRASEKKISEGELVTLDFGAYYKGYCSDITRTVAVGEINGELKTIYETVYEAQARGMQGIRPGMTGRQADALTRDYITEKGYGKHFGHSTGHGIGLEVHEGPSLALHSEVVLEPGMIVTVEPGIYISGLGGVRIEDDAVITKEGNESLTHSPKELLILG